jgi:hypothetical protein
MGFIYTRSPTWHRKSDISPAVWLRGIPYLRAKYMRLWILDHPPAEGWNALCADFSAPLIPRNEKLIKLLMPEQISRKYNFPYTVFTGCEVKLRIGLPSVKIADQFKTNGVRSALA